VWDVGVLSFVAGTSGTFNLAATLPSGVVAGGTFAVDPRGAALPAGVSLSPSGVLSVGAGGASAAVGVIFTYTEPGT
jgi:hypothetical protein